VAIMCACTDILSFVGDVLFDYRDVLLPPDIVVGSNKQSFSPQIETIRVGNFYNLLSI